MPAKTPPRALVFDQRLAVRHGVAADAPFQRVDQRVECGTARRAAPGGEVDGVGQPEAEGDLARLDLHRHQDAEVVGEITSSRTQREETDSEHHSATRALASRICRSICAAKSAPFTSS